MAQFHYKGSELSSYTDVYSTGKFCYVLCSVVVIVIADVHSHGWSRHWICLQQGFYLGFLSPLSYNPNSTGTSSFWTFGTRNLIVCVPIFFIAHEVNMVPALWLMNNEWLSKLYIIPLLSSLPNTSITLIWSTHSSFRRKFFNYNGDIFFSTANRILSHPNLLSNNFCGDVKLACILHGERWHWKQNGFRNRHNSNHYVPSWIS